MSVTSLLPTEVADLRHDLSDVVVVADRFLGVSADERVHTVSGLAAVLRGRRYRTGDGGGIRLRLGQGLTEHDIEYLQHVASVHAPHERVEVIGEVHEPTPRHQVHKYQNSNVLLADLVRESENVFTAALRVHGENELLSDHQTGEHIQGIVLIEAVRQLFLGAFELEYGVRRPQEHYYVVWNGIDLSFRSFVFPLPASLRASLHPTSVGDPAKLEFAIDVEIRQFDRVAAVARVEFAALPHERVSSIERAKAARAIAAYIGGGR